MIINDDWGLEDQSRPPAAAQGDEISRNRAKPGTFVHRIFRLVPLTELEQDGYGPGGPMSGREIPKFKEELVSERYFEGIG